MALDDLSCNTELRIHCAHASYLFLAAMCYTPVHQQHTVRQPLLDITCFALMPQWTVLWKEPLPIMRCLALLPVHYK